MEFPLKLKKNTDDKPPSSSKVKITFTHLVEVANPMGTLKSKFTNIKHAKSFARRQKEVGLKVKLFEIVKKNKLVEVKFR